MEIRRLRDLREDHDKSQKFRSTLEMLMLMDEALNHTEHADYQWGLKEQTHES